MATNDDLFRWQGSAQTPSPAAGLRSRIRVQIGAVVEHDPNLSFATNREVENDATDAVLAVFASWLREQSHAEGMQYRADTELQRLAEEIS